MKYYGIIGTNQITIVDDNLLNNPHLKELLFGWVELKAPPPDPKEDYFLNPNLEWEYSPKENREIEDARE